MERGVHPDEGITHIAGGPPGAARALGGFVLLMMPLFLAGSALRGSLDAGTTAALVGLALLGLVPFAWSWWIERRLALEGVRVSAEVVRVTHWPGGTGKPGWSVLYRYGAGAIDVAHERYIDQEGQPCAPGDVFGVLYDAAAPRRHGWLRTRHGGSAAGLPSVDSTNVVIGLFLLFTGVGFASLVRRAYDDGWLVSMAAPILVIALVAGGATWIAASRAPTRWIGRLSLIGLVLIAEALIAGWLLYGSPLRP